MTTETITPTAPVAQPDSFATPAITETRYHFTTADFARMWEIGIFTENSRVELMDGEVIVMSPIGYRHVNAINWLTEYLVTAKPSGYTVSVQNPLHLVDGMLPLPDLAVIHQRRYTATPDPADVAFVIEVSDSSITYDRARKLPRYASAGIAEAWIVDLTTDTLERHTKPRNGRYTEVIPATRGESLASTVLPALTLPASDILGERDDETTIAPALPETQGA